METKTMTQPSIENRIAAAFHERLPSKEVSALMLDVKAALKSAAETATAARERAFNSALPPDEIEQARRQMDDGEFRKARLEAALVQLKERVEELKFDED